jgi:hypothetical protein
MRYCAKNAVTDAAITDAAVADGAAVTDAAGTDADGAAVTDAAVDGGIGGWERNSRIGDIHGCFFVVHHVIFSVMFFLGECEGIITDVSAGTTPRIKQKIIFN